VGEKVSDMETIAFLSEFVRRLATMDPIGIIDYEADWSEVTPGQGPIRGCIFCKMSDYANPPHSKDCLWLLASSASAPPPMPGSK
jgi:hypothetical protein